MENKGNDTMKVDEGWCKTEGNNSRLLALRIYNEDSEFGCPHGGAEVDRRTNCPLIDLPLPGSSNLESMRTSLQIQQQQARYAYCEWGKYGLVAEGEAAIGCRRMRESSFQEG